MVETKPWSVQDNLKTPEDQGFFLEAALKLAIAENDPGFFLKALGDVAKARGMTDVAKVAGVTREGLYKALSEGGDPQLSTLFGVLDALGLKISISKKKLHRLSGRTKEPRRNAPALSNTYILSRETQAALASRTAMPVAQMRSSSMPPSSRASTGSTS